MPYFGDESGSGELVAGATPVNVGGAPMIPVTTTVTGSQQSLLDLDAGAINLLIGFRATAGAPDDTAASERLADFIASVQTGADNYVIFTTSTPVTNVYVVGIAIVGATPTGNCIDPSVGDAADAAAELVKFDFALPVSKIAVAMTPLFASGQEAQVSVEGYRNA